MNQDEITQAVDQFVRQQINIADGQSVEIDFTKGHGVKGITATLEITSGSLIAAPVAEPETTADKPAPEAVEEKPKAEPKKKTKVADISTGEERKEPEAAAEEEKADTAPKAGSIFSKAG